ncbi:MAG: methyltransferase domain-containing protein [Candidatus Micrarchaeota archaeon]
MDRVEFVLQNLRGKILDVGFAACSLHGKIKKKFPRKNIFGVDSEPVPKNANYKRGSAEKIPFEDKQFDSIMAGELIEHLHRPELFVQEAHRLLKKNGIMIITTPNRKSLINRLTRTYHASLHFSLFSIPELTAVLEKNGFAVEKLFCLPYNEESSPGSRHKRFYAVRKAVHFLVPIDSFREEIVLLARKK